MSKNIDEKKYSDSKKKHFSEDKAYEYKIHQEDDIGASPSPMVGYPIDCYKESTPYTGMLKSNPPMPEYGKMQANYESEYEANFEKQSHLMKKNTIKLNYDNEDETCYDEESYAYKKPLSRTRGLMVFYINTNGLPSEQALELLEKVKIQYQEIEESLRQENIQMMWLPTNTGSSNCNFFKF
jgi:hypothetical protein